MNRNFLFVLTLLSFTLSPALQAQDEAAAVKKTIETLFDGMRAGDSSMVHSVMMDTVIMQTIAANRQGKIVLSEGSLQNFLNSVGTPHKDVYDERILDYEIKIDGPMASAWTPYEFYVGERFSHCGVNSFQLMKTDEGWKMIYLVDTRRRQGCK